MIVMKYSVPVLVINFLSLVPSVFCTALGASQGLEKSSF